MIPVLFWSNFSSLTQGGQRSLSYILRDLDRSKYAPILACQKEGELTEFARKIGVPVETCRLPVRLRPRYLADALSFYSFLSRTIDKYNIGIVHSEEAKVVFLAFFIKFFRKLRTIWHVRVLWDTPFHKMIVLAAADAVICVSRSVAESFKSASKKIHVINNGIDPDDYKPGGQKAASPHFSGGDIVVGQIGTLVEHKRSHVFVQSAKIVIETHPDVKFVLIGTGEAEYLRYIEGLIKELGVERSVFMLGETADIRPLLNRLDIVCLLSKNEGLSRTLLESMANEKAIVVSAIPQNAELIIHNKTGLNARLDSPEATAEQINILLDDKKLAGELGANARKYVTEHFSLKTTIGLIHELYERLPN